MKINLKTTLILTVGLVFIIFIYAAYNFTSTQLQKQKAETEQKRQSFLFEKQSECKNICEKLYLKDIKDLSDSSVLNPSYAYNEKQNVCYYSGGWLEKDFYTQRVLNCQTNEEVLSYMTLDGKAQTGWGEPFVDSQLEYNKRERILMGY